MYQFGIDACEGYLYYSKIIEFMFLGMNMFWARIQTHFCLSRQGRVKMNSVKGRKHIYTQEHKLYYSNYN